MTLEEALTNFSGTEEEFYTDLANKIHDKLREKNAQKSVRLSFHKDTVDVTSSKLGGVPFIHVGGEYPTTRLMRQKLFFLFQINFAEMPHLDSYPTSGILQIFLDDDDLYGMDYNNKCNQNQWRILYHEDISNPLPREEAAKMMPELHTEMVVPLSDPSQEYGVTFTLETEPISISDYRFCSTISEICADFIPDEVKDADSIYFYPRPLFHNLLNLMSSPIYSKIGGYSHFIQEDYRQWERPDSPVRELLIQIAAEQIDGEYIMMWADGGSSYFFITPEALKNKDFTNVYYDWDCY